MASSDDEFDDPDSLSSVQARLKKGCECSDSCFRHFNPDTVHSHRLNIAELTKSEHEMYLMGLIMASLSNRKDTKKNTDRVRQRCSYSYHGHKVCLDAFVYLENTTGYQVKCIRNHLLKNGVVPRKHGNVGKKPHNAFDLDLYKNASEFLKAYLSKYSVDLSKAVFVTGESIAGIYKAYLGADICSKDRLMGYSTFRQFFAKQFPNVKFAKAEGKVGKVTPKITAPVEVPAPIEPIVTTIEDPPQTSVQTILLNQLAGPLLSTGANTLVYMNAKGEIVNMNIVKL